MIFRATVSLSQSCMITALGYRRSRWRVYVRSVRRPFIPGRLCQALYCLWLREGPRRSRWGRNVRSGKSWVQFSRPPECFSVWAHRNIRSTKRDSDRTWKQYDTHLWHMESVHPGWKMLVESIILCGVASTTDGVVLFARSHLRLVGPMRILSWEWMVCQHGGLDYGAYD